MARIDVLGLLTNTRSMLGSLTTWQEICGVSTAGEATERIYLGGVVAAPEEALAPICWLDVDPANFDWQGTSRGRVTIEARFEIAIPEDKIADYSQQFSWIWGRVSALMADINATVNGSGQLMLRSLTMPVRPGPIDPDDNDGRTDWMLQLGLVVEVI
jgi:hypothetical protein